MAYYLLDPLQLKEYGKSFFEGDEFSYRYQFSKRLFWQSIYIPWGPVCKSRQGFDNFLNHISNIKFSHVIVELPVIYSSETEKDVANGLISNGFEKLSYTLQSNETLLAFKDSFHLSSAKMNKVRAGKKHVDVEVKSQLTEDEVDEIYDVYKIAIARLDSKLVDRSVFSALSKNCLVAFARNKETKKLEGYTLGYFTDIGPSNYSDKPYNRAMVVVYTGLTDEGRDHRLGHCMHYDLFTTAFDLYDTDIINFHGASRTKNHTFLPFKLDFTDHFHELPGCYNKRRWF